MTGFEKNPSADTFLEHLNSVLSKGEQGFLRESLPDIMQNPEPKKVLFIVGPPRSGTTVLTQWLLSQGIGLPSNLAARLYKNPYIAGMMQRLLSDPTLDYKNELASTGSQRFESDYGKTTGYLSPHEFSYFIREYFSIDSGGYLDEKSWACSDVTGFLRGLYLFGHALNKPVALKALTFQYNLAGFTQFDNVSIIYTRRDESDTIRSLLRHRERVGGDVNQWLSIKPYGYERLKLLTPMEQVASQVALTNRSIEFQLKRFPAHRKVVIDHSQFCSSPSTYVEPVLALAGLRSENTTSEGISVRFQESSYEKDDVTGREISAALERTKQLQDCIFDEYAERVLKQFPPECD